MSCYIVQEIDGVSRFTLEDGSGFLLLENCIPTPGGGELPIGGVPIRRSRRRRKESIFDEDESVISVINEVI